MSETYVARRSMHYGNGNGEPVDRGQVIELVGLVNDAKLIRLGYVSAASKGVAIVACRYCGAKFTTDESLTAHGRDRHPSSSRQMTPEERELRDMERAEARQAKDDAIAPLDLTKTKASRGESATLEVNTMSAKKGAKSAASRGARTHIRR